MRLPLTKIKIKRFFIEKQNHSKKTVPLSPYDLAKQEWDDRIGNARVQAYHWRLIAMISSISLFMLLSLFLIHFTLNKNKIFIVEINKEGRAINLAPLKTPYTPSNAQKIYFISRFIKLTRSVSLDPVVLKQNLLSAYSFLTRKSSILLNEYLKKNNPVHLLNHTTVTIEILDIRPIIHNTFDARWIETTFDTNKENRSQQEFSGVFTMTTKQPRTKKEMAANPLGLYITDFHFSSRAILNEKIPN